MLEEFEIFENDSFRCMYMNIVNYKSLFDEYFEWHHK